MIDAQMKTEVAISDVVDTLNELLAADPAAAQELIGTRISVNSAELLDHPSIIFRRGDDRYTMGLIGLINGFFGLHESGFGPIAYEIGEDGKLNKFMQTPATISTGNME